MFAKPLLRHCLTALTLTLLLAAVPARASDDGMAAANEVSQASYYDFMDTYLFTHIGDNRGPSGPDLIPCRDNIVGLFQSWGLSVQLEPFTYNFSTYHNVVATKLGTVYPDQEFIIGAHYDSVDNPGADDNASGVALVLEAARVLSQYDSEYTIRFVAFSMEEQGLYGSEAYVNDHAADNILGMISADMVAYDPGSNYVNIYGRTASNPIKNDLAAAVAEYGDGLSYSIGGDTPYSDHAPFEAAGYQACLLIEGEVWGNPWYHTQDDNFEKPGNLNFPFAVQCTRSVVGWLVDQAHVFVDADYLSITHPFDLPEYAAPNGSTPVTIEVLAVGNAVADPTTATLHFDNGGGWQTVAMADIGAGLFEADLPATTCGDDVLYYFSIEDTIGEIYTEPRSAPAVYHTATAAYGEVVSFADNFETDQGWTAVNLGASTGDWQRGVPVDDDGWDYDPASDSDGSGQCFLTENITGNTDVDDGAVRLISPVLDLSAANVQIQYDYYLYLTDPGSTDHLLVEISPNSGAGPWTVIADHDSTGGLSWRQHLITSADLAAAGIVPTADMQLRFTANDSSPQSIVEAGLDAFKILALDCAPPFTLGDMNCDGLLDFNDINPLVLALTDPAGYAQQFPACEPLNGDFSGDGTLGFEDINAFVSALTRS